MKSTTKTTKTTKTTQATRRGAGTAKKAPAPTRAAAKAATGAKVRTARINKFDAATVSTTDLLKGRAAPHDFVLPCFLIGTVGQIVAAGGVGKSYFALQNAISVAIGCDVFGFWTDKGVSFKMKRGRVIYISAEDGRGVVQQRLKDACRGLTHTQRKYIRQNFELVCPSDFSIVRKANGVLVPSDWIEDMRASLAKRQEKPRLIIIDTLNRTLGDANENNASSMGTVQDVLKGVAETFQSAILLLHHTVKGSGDSESGLRQDAARGSGAGTNNCRWQANMVLEAGRDQSDPLEDQPLDRISFVISKANYDSKPGVGTLVRQHNGVLMGLSKMEVVGRVTRTSDHPPADNEDDAPHKRDDAGAPSLDTDCCSTPVPKAKRSL